jgi:RHS repeat-associated protein
MGVTGTNVELVTNTYEWKLVHIEDDIYYIVSNSDPNKAIEITGSSTADKTNIQIGAKANVDRQKFKLLYNDDGTYSIQSKVSNYTSAIDVSDGKFTNNQNIWQYKYSKDNMAQTYQIVDKDKAQGKYIETSYEYDTTGRYQTKVTDQRGNEAITNYNTNTGTVSSIVDAKNNTTSYSYNNMDKITSISSSNTTNSYTYDKDYLETISHNNFNYEFIYDSFGNTKTVKAANNILINNYYESGNGYLTHSIYGNNDRVDFTYDNFGRVKTKTNMVNTANYKYDNRGLLASLNYNNINTDYTYDLSGRLIKLNQDNEYKINYKYDNYNNLSSIKYNLNTINKQTIYTYDLDDKLTKIDYNGSDIRYTYDTLDRLIKKEIVNGTNTYTITYEYYDVNNTRTTTLLKSINNNGKIISYTYDNNGNIETVKENNLLKYKYYYDELNQLIKEEKYQIILVETIEYTYDNGGNILSKQIVPMKFTNGVKLTYTYGNTGWKDQLTGYNGKVITYDEIGNMKTYDGYTYNWTNGRELSSITKGTNNYIYEYNEAGIRTKKTVNGTETNYYLEGNNIIYEERDGYFIYYMYDELGVTGIEYQGNKYYYVKNLQGDIIEIVDEENKVVGRYIYDTWGKVINVENLNNVTVADINPYRYRSYYYDTETSLYYLNSRYYNPDIGRFISADGYVSTGVGILNHNMYAYSNNNPIMYTDSNGNWPNLLEILDGMQDGFIETFTGIKEAITHPVKTVKALLSNPLETLKNGVINTVDPFKTSRILYNLIKGNDKEAGKLMGNNFGQATLLYTGSKIGQLTSKYAMPKIVETPIFRRGIVSQHFNNTTKFMYYNRNIKGGTFVNYKSGSGIKYRIDWDPQYGFHAHPWAKH